MDRDATPGPLLGAQSLTLATRDTGSLEVLQEHVSLMDCGQEVHLLAHVSISVFGSYIMISVAISIPILQYETEPISVSIINSHVFTKCPPTIISRCKYLVRYLYCVAVLQCLSSL